MSSIANRLNISHFVRGTVIASLASTVHAPSSYAAEESRGESPGYLQEVIVTARQRDESLQRVPDSVTVLTADQIEKAGINDIEAVVNMTPNVFIMQQARAGLLNLTVRGVSTGQNGWAPVTFVVDGIPTATVEGFNQGTLFDLERVEVLKGPQSAVYGAGAIAGAINIVTRAPTDTLTGSIQAIAARGDDYQTNAAISGPLGQFFKFRLAGAFREKDGVYKDTDGRGLDIESHRALRARLIGEFSDVTLDLRAFVVDSRPGAYYQEMLPFTDTEQVRNALENFDTRPERGIIGREQRDIREFSGKLSWNMALGELALMGGHSTIDQRSVGSVSFVKPPAPATFCGPIGGAGEPADCFQDNTDDVETTTVDVRLTSPSDQRVRWLVGAAYIERETLNAFALDEGVAAANGSVVPSGAPVVFGSNFLRNDAVFGVFSQVNIDLTDRTELTLAGRWDRNRYDSTQYTDLTLSEPVPAADGSLKQRGNDSQFQPKVQLSYQWSDDVMSYVTVGRGFRSGYFNSGAQTAAETTMNYEIGLKSRLMDGRMVINSALYHIDYSDQQFTFITPEPPFRTSTNIPSTDIDGVEIEIAAQPTQALSLSAAVGVTDSRVSDGTESPNTPKFTLNLGAAYEQPLTETFDWLSRVDFRRQGAYYIDQQNQFNVAPKNYLNARTSLEWKNISMGLWVDNLLDEQQVNQIVQFPFYTIRFVTLPRTYGVDFRVRL